MIIVTVGTGYDYSDWYPAINYVATQTVLNPGEYYRIWQRTDCTLTGTPLPFDFNGCTVELYVDPDDQHGGDPTSGLVTYAPINWHVHLRNNSVNASHAIVDGLYIRRLTGGSGTILYVGNGQPDISDVEIRNTMVRGLGSPGEYGITAGNAEGERVLIETCKIWGCRRGFGWASGTTVPGDHIRYGTMRNVTIYGGENGIYGLSDSTDLSWDMRNVVVAGCSISCWDNLGVVNNRIYHCADSDGSLNSGAFNSQTITPANAFLSLDDTNPGFLKLADNSVLTWRGKAVPSLTEDIGGVPIPGPDGYFSIGCHEYPSAAQATDSPYLNIIRHLLPRAKAWQI